MDDLKRFIKVGEARGWRIETDGDILSWKLELLMGCSARPK